LTIADDGVGFSTSADPPKGMGMQIMRYRAAMVDGSISIRPGASRGTVIVCQCPLKA